MGIAVVATSNMNPEAAHRTMILISREFRPVYARRLGAATHDHMVDKQHQDRAEHGDN